MKELKKLRFPLCHTSNIIEVNTEANPTCLLWFHKNGATIDSSTLKQVITTGPLENTILFILGLGVPLNAEIMEHACRKKNIKAVQIFIERDCPCDKNSFLRAIENSSILMLKLLLEYMPCEATQASEELIKKAIELGDFLCLKYLHKNGLSWGKTLYEFIELIREDEENLTDEREACLRYIENNDKPKKPRIRIRTYEQSQSQSQYQLKKSPFSFSF